MDDLCLYNALKADFQGLKDSHGDRIDCVLCNNMQGPLVVMGRGTAI